MTSADDDQLYWRLGQFPMPLWTMPPINHLATNVLTRVRRQLLDTVRKFKEQGVLPPTAKRAELYGRVRGGHFLAPRATDWREAYCATLAAATWESVGKQEGA